MFRKDNRTVAALPDLLEQNVVIANRISLLHDLLDEHVIYRFVLVNSTLVDLIRILGIFFDHLIRHTFCWLLRS